MQFSDVLRIRKMLSAVDTLSTLIKMLKQAAQCVVDTTKSQESRTNRAIGQSRKRKFIFIWAAGARPPNVAQLSGDKDGNRDRFAHK